MDSQSNLIAKLVDGVHSLPGPNLAYEVMPGYALVKDARQSQRLAEINADAGTEGGDRRIRVVAYRPWESDNYEERLHATVGDALEDIAGILYEYRNPARGD